MRNQTQYLSDENHEQLLAEASGKTKQQLLELLAERWPKGEVTSQIRGIPAGAVRAGPTATLEPISGEMYCLQLSTSRVLKEKLELARDPEPKLPRRKRRRIRQDVRR